MHRVFLLKHFFQPFLRKYSNVSGNHLNTTFKGEHFHFPSTVLFEARYGFWSKGFSMFVRETTLPRKFYHIFMSDITTTKVFSKTSSWHRIFISSSISMNELSSPVIINNRSNESMMNFFAEDSTIITLVTSFEALATNNFSRFECMWHRNTGVDTIHSFSTYQ